MRKIKVYLYPNRREHIHDSDPSYVNTVPLSKKGIQDWVEVVGPDQAEFFYMGQISDGTQHLFHQADFQFFEGRENKHIVDIEGDWLGQTIPTWLKDSILTINGADLSLEGTFFVRPTFSTFLMNALNRTDTFPMPSMKSFGFRGLADPHGVRMKVQSALNKASLPHQFIFNNKWNGKAVLNGQDHKQYEMIMTNHLLTLCPRGAGRDSVRFYESCFFNRVPILIGNNHIYANDIYNFPDILRIDESLSIDAIADKLRIIWELDISELHHLAHLSRLYFDTHVRHYFNDPTLRFLEFLERSGLI